MSRWFRFYDAALDDPKVQRLPDVAFRAWVNLLCVASRNEGKIPESLEDLSFSLRKSIGKTREILQILISSGLVDAVENGFEPHNWAIRQYKSDVSTARVKRFRKQAETVSETPPDTDTDTDTDTESKKDTSEAAPQPSPVDLVPFIEIPTNRFDKTGEQYPIYDALIEEFQGLYPAVDVRAELRKIRGWSLSKPQKRKTRRGMKAFVNGWLTRQQDEHPRETLQGNSNGRRDKPPTAHDNHNAGTVLYLEKLQREDGGQGANSDPPDAPRKLLLAP